MGYIPSVFAPYKATFRLMGVLSTFKIGRLTIGSGNIFNVGFFTSMG